MLLKLSTHPMTVKGTQKLKSRELKFILPSNLSKRPRGRKNLTLSVFDGSTCALCDVSSCNVVTSLKLHISAHWIQMGSKPHLRVKIQWVLQIGVLPYVGKTKIFPFNSIEIKKEQNPWYLRQTLHFGIIVWGKLYWGCCGCCSMGGDANFTSLPFPGVSEQREGWVLVRR